MWLLDQEEAEIQEKIKEREDLKTTMKVVKAKRVMLPSQRTSDGTAKGEEVLPGYKKRLLARESKIVG